MMTFREIVDKIDQLQEAQILLAALQLKIFSHLDKKSLTSAQVAKKAGTQKEGTEMLLYALSAMGALKSGRGRFSNTRETYTHFCESSPQFKRGFIHLRQSDYEEFGKLVQTVRDGRAVEEYEGPDDPEFRGLFTHAMEERSGRFCDQIVEIVTRKPVGHILDIGGGSGAYSAALLKKDKQARATLLDRPATLNVAREIIAGKKLLNRFEFLEGDLFESAFGKNYDAAYYSNILHIYNASENKRILGKVFRCLKPGGRLWIVDYFVKENRTEPVEAALFAITMLLYTETGKVYSYKEAESLVRKVGFTKLKGYPLPGGAHLLEVVKPKR